MNKISLLLLVIFCGAYYCVCQEPSVKERKISKDPMLAKHILSDDERVKIDEAFQADKEMRKVEINKVLEKYSTLFVQSKDIGLDCVDSTDMVDFFYSKRYQRRINIIRTYSCKPSRFAIHLAYYIFMDGAKAKMGANELLSGSSEPIYEDEVGGSFTGRKYGEFCVHSGRPERGPYGISILYGKYMINIVISSKDPMNPELLDKWADAVINKVKAFNGEATP